MGDAKLAIFLCSMCNMFWNLPVTLCAFGTFVNLSDTLRLGEAQLIKASDNDWCYGLWMTVEVGAIGVKADLGTLAQLHLAHQNHTLDESTCLTNATEISASSALDDSDGTLAAAVTCYLMLIGYTLWQAVAYSMLRSADGDEFASSSMNVLGMQHMLFGSLANGRYQKCVRVIGLLADWIAFSWLPVALLAPLASLRVHDDVGGLIVMRFHSGLWKSIVVLAGMLVAGIGCTTFAMIMANISYDVDVDKNSSGADVWYCSRVPCWICCRRLFRCPLIIAQLGVVVAVGWNALHTRVFAVLFIDVSLIFEFSFAHGLAGWSAFLRLGLFILFIITTAITLFKFHAEIADKMETQGNSMNVCGNQGELAGVASTLDLPTLDLHPPLANAEFESANAGFASTPAGLNMQDSSPNAYADKSDLAGRRFGSNPPTVCVCGSVRVASDSAQQITRDIHLPNVNVVEELC